MKLELSEISFNSNLSREYVIYGTGEIGRMLKRTLELLGNKVVLFLCSDGYKKENTIDGIKVLEFTDFVKANEQRDILLTVQRGSDNIKKIVKNSISNKIIEINSFEDVLNVYKFFYNDYFNKKKIDISQEYIDIDGVCFINPFISDSMYALAFFMECGDLILPAIYDDLSCIHEGPYEKGNVKIDRDDIVIDCGSNMGLFSIVVAGRCKKVYAFEPVEATQSYIEKMSKIYKNIELCNFALSDKIGIAKFSANSDTNFANHIIDDDDEKGIIVNLMTIDEFVEKNGISKVDYIKADIEGAERDMLRGATKTLRKYAPKLSICEYHLKDDPQVLEKIILEANPNYIVKHEYMKIYAYVPE